MSSPTSGEQFLADLDARGLIHDSTDRSALAARLSEGPIGVYVGFDPTADSLHAGNLLGQVMLRRFQLAGHRPVVLAGGATGMVGDPGGRSEERNLLDRDTLNHNVACVKRQLEKILDFDTASINAARLVDNAEWTAPMGHLNFSAMLENILRSIKWWLKNLFVHEWKVNTEFLIPSSVICCYKPMISGIYVNIRMSKCKWVVLINGEILRLVLISFAAV